MKVFSYHSRVITIEVHLIFNVEYITLVSDMNSATRYL